MGADTEFKTFVKTGLPITQNGYLYVYTSNESPVDACAPGRMFFDNLQVTHVRGHLLEESHYYPFGLTMGGISSKAAGIRENKKQKFQGQELASNEFSDGSGLEMYEFKWRMHDLQTGRFWQIDPLAEKYVYNSTYAFSENKVTGHIELEGLESVNVNDVRNPYVRAALKDNVQANVNSMRRNGSEAVQVSVSAGVGVGVKAKVGKAEVSAGVSGPQVEVSVNGGGKVEGKGSLASAGVKVGTPLGEGKAGVSVGTASYADGKVSTNLATSGVSGDISSSKEIKDGKTSQSLGANLLDATVTVGVKLGAVGIEISANVVKAKDAVVDFVSGVSNWMINVVKEKTTMPKSSDFPKQ